MLDAAQEPEKFAVLHRPGRIWAISPVHGDMTRLRALHAYIEPLFDPGAERYGDMVEFGGLLGRAPVMAVNGFSTR